MEFVCFAEYDNIKKIGFLDRRENTKGHTAYPLSEHGDKIAFITRKLNGEPFGQLYLNILNVNTYDAGKNKFELYTTTYEANMAEGVCDDTIQKAFVM